LQLLARVLRERSRNVDFVYRYGGEEFLLISVDNGSQSGMVLAERIVGSAKRAASEPHDGVAGGAMTISVGVAAAPEHGTNFDLLLERADAALYAAKQTGRDRAVVWGESLLTNAA
jgi:diguanylate cyclase (GGDEF)-like protein